MPPLGARPPDPYVLSGLDPAHRELVELLYRLYAEQQEVLPRSLEAIGRKLGGRKPVGRSTVLAYLHGTRVPPDARRFAEVLGGTETDLARAADLARKIQPRKPTGWSLGGDDAADHLALRAAGRRPGDGRGGDLFTGRARAIDRIQQWLQARDCPGTVLVVTGQPGAGKSSVVARTVRDLEANGAGDGLFFHARGGTRDDLLDLVRRQTRDQSITSAEGWVAHLQRRPTDGRRPLLIVIDALDEAVSGSETTRISQLLTSIAAHPAARVVAATRRGHRDQLLRGLGARTVDASNLVDLDSDAYFDSQDLQRLVARLLTQDDVSHPGPPGRAWTQYRGDADLTDRLAAVIARRADRSFLVAAFAAHSLSTATEIVDPSAAGFDETLIPSSVAEAFTKYFDTIPDERQRFRTRRLLTALAFAYGPGLDDDTWLLFADALGLTAARGDVLQLRRSPVADYLLETHPAEPGQPVRTRLYHQALVDQLRDEAEPDDGPRILRHLTPTDDHSWANTTPYLRRYLIDHAAADGDLLDLLRRPGYLSIADLHRVLAALPPRPSGELRDIAALLRLGSTGSDRNAQLQQTLLLLGAAGHLGLDSWRRKLNLLANTLRGPSLLWAHSITSAPHQVIGGQHGPVYAVAIGRLGDRDVIVSGSNDGSIRIWDQNGRPIGDPLTGHAGHVISVAIGRLGDRDVIVSGSNDGSIRIWDQHGRPIGDPLTGHASQVISVAIGRLGDRDVIVSGSDFGSIHISDQHATPILYDPLNDYYPVTSVAVGRLGDQDVIVSGSRYETIRIWDQDGRPIGHPLAGHSDWVTTVAVGRLGDENVIVSGSRDETIRIWNQNGNPISDPLTGHRNCVNAVAVGQLGDQDVIVSGSDDRTLRIWDQHGRPIGDPLTGHAGHVFSVAIGRLGDRDVIVSGSDDGSIRIWDQDDRPIGDPLAGHSDWVTTVAVGRLGDENVIVSGSRDETIRIWNQNGNPISDPLTDDDEDYATTVAIGRLGDRDIIVSGSFRGDCRIRIWDQHGTPIVSYYPLTDVRHWVATVAIGRLGDRDVVVIVSDSDDGSIRIWDQHGRPIGDPLTGHAGHVFSVAIGRLGDRDVIVSGSGSNDGSIRIWDQDGRPIGDPLTGHAGHVFSVAIGRLGDRDVIVSGSNDGSIRIWDQHGRPIGDPLTGHASSVNTVAIGHLGDRDVIISGGDDRTIRIWDQHHHQVGALPLVDSVVDVALQGAVVYAAVGRALVAWQLE